MRITIHGHRPACFHSAAEATAAPNPATAANTSPRVQKINLGFFKIKIHRQTALQTTLINALASPPEPQGSPLDRPTQASTAPVARTPNEWLTHWDEWAQRGNPYEENRPEAVRRLTHWLNRNSQRVEPLPLNLSHLGLTSVPELPEGLERLNLTDNLLAQLPSNFPTSLKSLCALGNQIEHPPENLPRGLIELDLAFNFISQFPDNLPPNLLRLEMGFNDLSTLPDIIPQLCNENSFIDLEGNLLSDEEFARLSVLTTSPDYTGPRIYFSMYYAAPPTIEEQARPLDEAVLAWPPGPGVDRQAKAQLWRGFAAEPGAEAFSQFLERLRGTINFGNPQFQLNVADWLTQLETHPDLRASTFAISEGSTTSCEDRVSLTFNTMRQLRLSSAVARGDYDQNLPELISLARGMFRLDQLEVIAREKAASLNFVDEIEVYLAYQVKLRDVLALPLETPDMRFFNMSHVSQQDLDDAVTRVKNAEAEGFKDYLSSQWQPWQAVLERLDPERHRQAQNELLEAMESTFDKRLQTQLQTLGLDHDADAQRLVGPQIKAEITHEIHGAMTRQFLERRGLLSQLNPH